ncbi:arginine ABC transporter substrate-binding protein [Legionella busanensis]|uniref:Arginine ABC transporter substrate-binding protein n=1 Tax=Legionella busanensis TaxID=190655 RepID=A0A378JLS9_9GAMM|nr:transporter substrate-binding domain-containing protein [Legionella busanensis]STX52174.1 arginine ABC transporter substrate-binding protein [Legionella busanensis]
MKRILIFTLLICINIFTFAQDTTPLRIGVDNFYPPYVMRAGNNQVFGFDISIMEGVCQLMNKKCIYYPMPFTNLLSKVEQGELDAAVGAITITPERASHVSFSIPYLNSQARFLSNKNVKPDSFNLATLKNYNIGAVRGTIFPRLLNSLGIADSRITLYDRFDFMIDSLGDKEIDIAIMDNASAINWQEQSSNVLIALGQPFNYGYGIAIAINRNKTELISEINGALEKYLKGSDYKKNYDKYLSYF